MTQIEQGWGAGPSPRYESLAAPFRPVIATIRDSAVSRDVNRILPRKEIEALREAGFTTLRLPNELGGLGVTLPELFALLIELSEADPNVTNALRSHFGFTEDVLNSAKGPERDFWLSRIAAREISGSGFSESGDSKLTAFSTRLERKNGHWLLNGEKYYTTGSLFADWINLGATDEKGDPVGAVVATRSKGVDIIDDWDGFGQALTASGTARFTNVEVPDDHVQAPFQRFPYASSFFQLVHLATLAGIGRAAANDLARHIAGRKRVYSHGNALSVSEDPQILQVAGRVRGNAYGAGAIVLKAAEALQRAYDLNAEGTTPEAVKVASEIAEIEVSQAVTVVSNLVLEGSTLLFDALGASAAKRPLGLDRHWRNARTISSHNPRVYRDRIVGDFAVNGTRPAGQYRVGQA